jgi:Uma2 family endonuclease
MSTMTLPAPVTTAKRLWTIADVSALPDDLPTGPAKYHLEDGELTIMAPPGGLHSGMQSHLFFELRLQGERAGYGKARTEIGLILSRNPDTLFDPDCVFVANASLPFRYSTEGYLETIPELIVEVRSKNDTLAELERKAAVYLAAGSVVAWVVDPVSQSVREYRQGQPLKVFASGDALVVPDVIPGFSVLVSTIFAE